MCRAHIADPPRIAQQHGHMNPMFRIRLISAGIHTSNAKPQAVRRTSIISTTSSPQLATGSIALRAGLA